MAPHCNDTMLRTSDYLATCDAVSTFFYFIWPEPKTITICIRKFQSVLIKFIASCKYVDGQHFLDSTNSTQ